VLRTVIYLLHPVMPFITEELNGILFPGSERVISRAWPQVNPAYIRPEIEKAFDRIFAIVEGVRSVRGRYGVTPSQKLQAAIRAENAETRASVLECQHILRDLGGLASIACDTDLPKPKFSASVVVPNGELFIPLEGLLDPVAEIARLQKEIEKAESFAASIEKKLSNEKFVSGAPQAVVDGEKQKLATQLDIVAKCKNALAELE